MCRNTWYSLSKLKLRFLWRCITDFSVNVSVFMCVVHAHWLSLFVCSSCSHVCAVVRRSKWRMTVVLRCLSQLLSTIFCDKVLKLHWPMCWNVCPDISRNDIVFVSWVLGLQAWGDAPGFVLVMKNRTQCCFSPGKDSTNWLISLPNRKGVKWDFPLT